MSGRPAALPVALDGVSILGPGLNDWAEACEILTGVRAYECRPTLIPLADSLPPAERRRTGRVVNLALAAGFAATADSGTDVTGLCTVFASSGADSNNCHEILNTLASADRQLSPTRFHNSVHNVTAGYWSIATRDTAPYTVVCAYDGSFAAGLLEAWALVNTRHCDVLLVAYDVDYPPPLRAKRPIPDACGVALLLRPQRTSKTLAILALALSAESPDVLGSPPLEALRVSVPAARSLPLLTLLANHGSGVTHLEYLLPHSLAVTVTP